VWFNSRNTKLEAIYKQYKDKILLLLAFQQIISQEPGTNAEIGEFYP
jgi:glutathione peroxidase-family protein